MGIERPSEPIRVAAPASCGRAHLHNFRRATAPTPGAGPRCDRVPRSSSPARTGRSAATHGHACRRSVSCAPADGDGPSPKTSTTSSAQPRAMATRAPTRRRHAMRRNLIRRAAAAFVARGTAALKRRRTRIGGRQDLLIASRSSSGRPSACSSSSVAQAVPWCTRVWRTSPSAALPSQVPGRGEGAALIVVGDVEASIAFYETLGLEVDDARQAVGDRGRRPVSTYEMPLCDQDGRFLTIAQIAR
jgi:hypothetical protein